MFFYLFIGLVLLSACLVAFIKISVARTNKRNLASIGITSGAVIAAGKYVAGHPGLDHPFPMASLAVKDHQLLILDTGFEKAQISSGQITGITAEDATTVERKISVARLVTLGLFAFAFPTHKKNELAYLTVQWNDGRFSHETYFELAGQLAVQTANTTRNLLIKALAA